MDEPAPTPALVIPDELKLAIEQYNQRKITLKELITARQKLAPKLEIMVSLPLSMIANHDDKFMIYDMVIDRNPKYPKGDNRTRNEFIHSPYYHPKGKFFQEVKHKVLIEAINYGHKLILKGYDMDAYVFDDPRLQAYCTFFREYIKENFQNAQYKIEFMNKVVDLIMFHIKEDPYYAARFLDIFNKIPKCELTEEEQLNIAKWH